VTKTAGRASPSSGVDSSSVGSNSSADISRISDAEERAALAG
jgi:hypothetical protein